MLIGSSRTSGGHGRSARHDITRRAPSSPRVTHSPASFLPSPHSLSRAAPGADAEETWLHDALGDLRRLVPDESGCPTWAGGEGLNGVAASEPPTPSSPPREVTLDHAEAAFVQVVTRARLAMGGSSARGEKAEWAAAPPPPPLPTLPLGARLASMREVAATITGCEPSGAGVASDLSRLWANSRLPRAANPRAPVVPSGSATEDPHPSSPEADRAVPVAPLAIVGWLRLSPAESLDAACPNPDDVTVDPSLAAAAEATGLVLEDTTGVVPVAVVGLPDARMLNRRVMATAWVAAGGSRVLEVETLTCLDGPLPLETPPPPMPAPPGAIVAAPLPPRSAGEGKRTASGLVAVGSVVAVSPVVNLRDRDPARRARFFLVELGRCPRCQRGGPSPGTHHHRIIFSGEALTRWRPFFGAVMGGEYGGRRAGGGWEERAPGWAGDGFNAGGQGEHAEGGNSCGCVRVTGLRKFRLLKGEGPEREIRLAAATSATAVTPGTAPPVASQPNADEELEDDVRCRCDTCERGVTLGRYEAGVVLGPDAAGLGVMVGRRPGSNGIPLLMTHAVLGEPRSGTFLPALRRGARVVLTHAHPVWKRWSEHGGCDDGNDDDCGLRAIGACVRTRVRVASTSPLDAAPPVLFEADEREVVGSNPGGGDDAAARGRAAASMHLRRACDEGGFVTAAGVLSLAVALTKKFDCASSAGRRTASRLLLGKRRRGMDTSVSTATEEEEGLSLVAALRRLQAQEGDRCGISHDPCGASTTRRLSIYHEFFAPSGLGGDEEPVPAVPVLTEVRRLAVAAFDAARAAEAGSAPCTSGSGGTRGAALPYGGAIGAVAVARVVLDGSEMYSGRERGGELLLGWLRESVSAAGALRQFDVVDDSGQMEVLIEPSPDSGSTPSVSLSPGMMFMTRRWRVVCEGAAEAGRNRSVPPRIAQPRCYVRAAAEDLVPLSSSRIAPRGEDRAPPPQRPVASVSDLLVWHPERKGGWCRGAGEGNAAPPIGGGAVGRGGGGGGEGGGEDFVTHLKSWPPPPSLAPPFLAIVVSEEYRPDSFGRGWSLQYTLRDVNTPDRVDVYASQAENAAAVTGGLQNSQWGKRFPPLGMGVGATVLVRDALRAVSGSRAVYLRLTPQSRVEVHVPAQATLVACWPEQAAHRDNSLVVRHPPLPRLAPPLEQPRRVTLWEVMRGVCASIGAIDKRVWEVRARITDVMMLTVRWGCRHCGCDAGSMGAAAAAAAATAHNGGVMGGVGGPGEIEAGSLAGCAACRPHTGGTVSSAAAAALAAESACAFEVEASVSLDDGTCRAEAWIKDEAGASLLPPSLKSAALALARRHGRVTARLTQVGAEAADPGESFSAHVLKGYAALAMSEVEGAPLLAAVGHAQSLGEMLMRVQLDYKVYDTLGWQGLGAGVAEGVGVKAERVQAFGAASMPTPVFKKVTLQGEPTWMNCAPFPRLRAFALAPVEPVREAAAAAAALS